MNYKAWLMLAIFFLMLVFILPVMALPFWACIFLAVWRFFRPKTA